MLISCGYDISLKLHSKTSVLLALHIHPSRAKDLVKEETFCVEPNIPIETYFDQFGNRCMRLSPPAGILRVKSSALVRDSGEPDPYVPEAKQDDVSKLPTDLLPFLLSSRYCEVDSDLISFAWDNFGDISSGWSKVEAISNFCHNHIEFDYQKARANRTAVDAFNEKTGVCRDFTHLAITLCRAMNIPARYVTGYLGDIGVPPSPHPIDFCAWMEVYIGGRWFTFDPRNNERRIGRVVIARGRDANDVAMATVFGHHDLEHFNVVTEEVTVLTN